MGRNRIEVDIIANDRSSRIYNDVSRSTQSMANKINNSITSINRGLRNYNNAMSSFNRNTKLAVAGASYAIYRFTTDSIKQFAEFEKQHGKTMGAMASNYEKTAQAQRKFFDDQNRLKTDSLRMGTLGPTGKGALYNPQQVAYSQTALVKAGISPKEISTTTAVPQILKFAGGNDLGIEQATEYAVNIGQQFNIPMAKWGDMLDKVTRAADISTIDVPDVFESLKYTGGIAAGLKRPLEEILAMIAVMGNAGLRGSMAGTGIQAFFTRILSPIGKSEKALETAPTPFARQALEAFVASTTTASGKFKTMPEVTENLDTVMAELNDKEQAWFAQKLFGLFQMKAAYALKNTGGANLENVIKDINKNAPGTNDRKWDIMLDTSWGKQTALRNAWTGIKTDVGYRLSPTVNAIADELFRVISDKGNYRIDFTKLKKSIKDSGDMIAEQYGKQMGEIVKSTGNLLVDSSRAAYANEPLGEGIIASLGKLLSGDVGGSVKEMSDAIRRTNKRIDELPPELQGMAKQVRNVTLALTTLAGVNIATKLLENLTTIWRYSFGKLIAANMNVTATTVILRDTGMLNKNGQPIYRQETTATGGTTGGTGGTRGPAGPVIVGSDGKPVKGSGTGTGGTTAGSTIVDRNGNPIQSPATGTKPSMGSKIGKGLGIASWIYAISEMTGINDKLLDSTSAKEGTKSREVIDKGRNVLNWGLMAHFVDSLLLKGAGTRAIGAGVRGLVGAVPGTMAATGMTGIGGAAALVAPLGIGAAIIADLKMKQDTAKKIDKDIATAKSKGDKWIWNDASMSDARPWWNPNGMFMKPKNPIINLSEDANMDARKYIKEEDAYKYNNGHPMVGLREREPKKGFAWEIFGDGHESKAYKEWAKRDAAQRAQDAANESRFYSAQQIWKAQTGLRLTYNEFSKNIGWWQSHNGIDQSTGKVRLDYSKGLSTISKPDDYFNNLFNSAQILFEKRIGKEYTADRFKKDKDVWMNSPDIDASGNIRTEVQRQLGIVSQTNNDMVSQLQNIVSALQSQRPPQVSVAAPNVNVNVTVDSNGKILEQKTYISDFSVFDKYFGMYGSRNGGGSK